MQYNYKFKLSISFLITFLFILSCDINKTTDIDKSLEFIESTVPIPEAQDVTMEVRRVFSEGAHFLISLNSIDQNNQINNGEKRGWCIEWDVPLVRETQNGVKLHSTKNTAYWNEMNYLLNQIDNLKEEYQGLTWKEIQIVIWKIADYKEFDIDKIPEYSNLERYYEDGEYKFDVELAKEITQIVRKNADNATGDKYGIIVENQGQILVTTND